MPPCKAAFRCWKCWWPLPSCRCPSGCFIRRWAAALLAESLLALHETVPAQGLAEGGESAGMAWQLRSAPFATPVSSANPAAPLLHELRITVRWGDDPPREMTLQTLRPEQRPQPGGLMR